MMMMTMMTTMMMMMKCPPARKVRAPREPVETIASGCKDETFDSVEFSDNKRDIKFHACRGPQLEWRKEGGDGGMGVGWREGEGLRG